MQVVLICHAYEILGTHFARFSVGFIDVDCGISESDVPSVTAVREIPACCSVRHTAVGGRSCTSVTLNTVNAISAPLCRFQVSTVRTRSIAVVIANVSHPIIGMTVIIWFTASAMLRIFVGSSILIRVYVKFSQWLRPRGQNMSTLASASLMLWPRWSLGNMCLNV